jgi:hypothetical protein
MKAKPENRRTRAGSQRTRSSDTERTESDALLCGLCGLRSVISVAEKIRRIEEPVTA